MENKIVRMFYKNLLYKKVSILGFFFLPLWDSRLVCSVSELFKTEFNLSKKIYKDLFRNFWTLNRTLLYLRFYCIHVCTIQVLLQQDLISTLMWLLLKRNSNS